MVQKEASPVQDPKKDQLIFALLKYATKEEAARKSGIPHNTMYRWLRDPAFKAAYLAARRDVFDDAMLCLEKTALKAAQTLANELDEKTYSYLERSPLLINAAKAVLDRAFKAQDSIAVQEELAALGAVIDALKAAQQVAPAPVAEKPAEIRNSVSPEREQADADLLRVTWMGELGNSAADIEASLRYNRPQNAAAEAQLLDIVRELLEEEKKYTDAVSPP